MSQTNARPSRSLPNAVPFFAAYLLVPLMVWTGLKGGLAPLLVPLTAWYGVSLADRVLGVQPLNADPQTPTRALTAHRLATLLWLPTQTALLIWALAYTTITPSLEIWEKLGRFFAMGVLSSAIGIVFAHELLHQPTKLERWSADLLLATALYSHFRSEHLLVHHVHVGTPRDTVTAPYGEGFWRFLIRVVPAGLRSAWRAERRRMHRSDRQTLDAENPFWRYWALQGIFLFAALVVGGWQGLALFIFQALVAIWHLELINYIEHYGLTRKKLTDGSYERQGAHHSWDSAQRASNWFLINLPRHADHHMHPSRRYPLLQHHGETHAPQLPYGYGVMGFVALFPGFWRRRMNPRVARWRAKYYPEIADWRPYNRRQFRS